MILTRLLEINHYLEFECFETIRVNSHKLFQYPRYFFAAF